MCIRDRTYIDLNVSEADTFRYTIIDGTRHPVSVELPAGPDSLDDIFDAIIADSDNYEDLGFTIERLTGDNQISIRGYVHDGEDASIGFIIENDDSLLNILRILRTNGANNAADGVSSFNRTEVPDTFTGYHWEQLELFDDVIFANDSNRDRIAIGAGATADTEQAISIGHNSSATGISSVALGHNAATTIEGEIRLGSSGATVRVHPMVAGTETHDNQLVSKVYVDSEISSASNANAAGISILESRIEDSEVRIGGEASVVNGTRAIAIGFDADATDTEAIAIGVGTRATNRNSIAIGGFASAAIGGSNQIAIGHSANADGTTGYIPFKGLMLRSD